MTLYLFCLLNVYMFSTNINIHLSTHMYDPEALYIKGLFE